MKDGASEIEKSLRPQNRHEDHMWTNKWAKKSGLRRQEIEAGGQMKQRCPGREVVRPLGGREGNFGVCWSLVPLRPRDTLCPVDFSGVHGHLWSIFLCWGQLKWISTAYNSESMEENSQHGSIMSEMSALGISRWWFLFHSEGLL